jgi:hypothetical protein
MSIPEEETLHEALASVLLDDNKQDGIVDGIDSDIVSYLAGMLHESGLDDVEGSIGHFLEGYGCPDDIVQKACDAVAACGKNTQSASDTITKNGIVESNDGAVKLNKIVSMSSTLSEHTDAEIDQTRFLWGQDNKIAAMVR